MCVEQPPARTVSRLLAVGCAAAPHVHGRGAAETGEGTVRFLAHDWAVSTGTGSGSASIASNSAASRSIASISAASCSIVTSSAASGSIGSAASYSFSSGEVVSTVSASRAPAPPASSESVLFSGWAAFSPAARRPAPRTGSWPVAIWTKTTAQSRAKQRRETAITRERRIPTRRRLVARRLCASRIRICLSVGSTTGNAASEAYRGPKRRVRKLLCRFEARQLEGHPRPTERRVVHPGAAALALDDRAGDAQPKAAPSRRPPTGSLAAVEAV